MIDVLADAVAVGVLIVCALVLVCLLAAIAVGMVYHVYRRLTERRTPSVSTIWWELDFLGITGWSAVVFAVVAAIIGWVAIHLGVHP